MAENENMVPDPDKKWRQEYLEMTEKGLEVFNEALTDIELGHFKVVKFWYDQMTATGSDNPDRERDRVLFIDEQVFRFCEYTISEKDLWLRFRKKMGELTEQEYEKLYTGEIDKWMSLPEALRRLREKDNEEEWLNKWFDENPGFLEHVFEGNKPDWL